MKMQVLPSICPTVPVLRIGNRAQRAAAVPPALAFQAAPVVLAALAAVVVVDGAAQAVVVSLFFNLSGGSP